jgi:hypothetical protein
MKKIISITFVTVVLMLNGCQHKPDLGPPCVAGSGGTLSIVAYAIHGTIAIPNYYTHPDTAFVKFGTTRSPGTNPANYNTYFVSDPGEDHIHCYGLKCGDYFIYRTAWDSLENVRRYGGFGINISDANGGASIEVPVN